MFKYWLLLMFILGESLFILIHFICILYASGNDGKYTIYEQSLPLWSLEVAVVIFIFLYAIWVLHRHISIKKGG